MSLLIFLNITHLKIEHWHKIIRLNRKFSFFVKKKYSIGYFWYTSRKKDLSLPLEYRNGVILCMQFRHILHYTIRRGQDAIEIIRLFRRNDANAKGTQRSLDKFGHGTRNLDNEPTHLNDDHLETSLKEGRQTSW